MKVSKVKTLFDPVMCAGCGKHLASCPVGYPHYAIDLFCDSCIGLLQGQHFYLAEYLGDEFCDMLRQWDELQYQVTDLLNAGFQPNSSNEEYSALAQKFLDKPTGV